MFIMAGSADASVIYNTNAASTLFTNSGTLTMSNTLGVAATLTFTPDSNSTTGVPSSIALGDFLLACSTCSTQANGVGSFFPAFTFNLVITDVTDGATGRFTGTSTGGAVWSDVSQISITWAPLQLGSGPNNASTGSFGPTVFTTTSFTGIVAPNSGTPAGDSTVQGFVGSTAIPEPATLSLIGGGFVFLGMLRRKKFFHL
jgi:hypothetical protein